MLKNKTKSNLRLIFSSLALIAFVLYSLYDNIIVTEYTSYYTYGWRLSLMNDLFLMVPFVSLLVFAFLERKLEYVNGRAYMFGIFALYTIQALFIFFGDPTSEFSIFTCSFLGRGSDITIAILMVRMVMLFLIPIAHKIMLKIYSIGMISFFVIKLIALLTTDSLYIRIHRSVTGIVISLIVDILFHVALFFFSDLLDKRNESDSWLCFLDILMYPIFGSLYEDDEDEYFDEITSEIHNDNTHIHEKNSRNKLNMINHCEYFSEDALKSIDTFEIGGKRFLLDPPKNSVLRFDLEREGGKTAVSGCFTHTFTEEQAAKILKKKSVLNKTFKYIEMEAITDTDIGVESIEEGTFTVKLASKEFDTSENCDDVRKYMLRFMDAIIIIQNTESYE